mgnify:CR=1 FL=1
MDNAFKKLIDEIKNSPKKILATIKKLMENLKGTVELEVPEKFAVLFDKFDAVDDTGATIDDDTKKLIKFSMNPKNIRKEMEKSGAKKTVKLNLSKVKRIVTRDSKKAFSDAKDETMTESFSLLDDEYMSEEALSVGIVGFLGAYYVLTLAIVVFCWYVIFEAVKYNHVNAFNDDNLGKGLGLSIVCMVFLTFIWALLVHAQIQKIKSKSKSSGGDNLSDSDSILEDLSFDPDALYSNEKDRDTKVIEAYRTVADDLKKRVVADTDPMTEDTDISELFAALEELGHEVDQMAKGDSPRDSGVIEKYRKVLDDLAKRVPSDNNPMCKKR